MYLLILKVFNPLHIHLQIKKAVLLPQKINTSIMNLEFDMYLAPDFTSKKKIQIINLWEVQVKQKDASHNKSLKARISHPIFLLLRPNPTFTHPVPHLLRPNPTLCMAYIIYQRIVDLIVEQVQSIINRGTKTFNVM